MAVSSITEDHAMSTVTDTAAQDRWEKENAAAPKTVNNSFFFVARTC